MTLTVTGADVLAPHSTSSGARARNVVLRVTFFLTEAMQSSPVTTLAKTLDPFMNSIVVLVVHAGAPANVVSVPVNVTLLPL